MSRSFRHGYLFVLASILFVGCGKKDLPDPDSAGPAPAAASVGPPLTDEDYKAFSQQLENAVATGNTADADHLLRLLDLFERSIGDLELGAQFKKDLAKGAARGAGKLSHEFVDCVKNGGSYIFLHVHSVDGQKRALFRMRHAEGAVNYHDYSLARYPDGQIGTADIYVYLSGEPMSQSFRRVLLTLVSQKDQGMLARLKGADQILTNNLSAVQSMSNDVRSGRHKEALATFRKLPAELQNNRAFQMIAIQAAQGTKDDREYLAEMERFRKTFPNDPSADLLSLDYFMLKKQFDEGIQSLDRLNKSLGQDPYLDVLKGGMLLEAGRLKEARAVVERAIKADMKIDLGYGMRVAIALREKNNKDVLIWLKKGIENNAVQVDIDELKNTPDYAEFVKSPEFQDLSDWLAKRPK